MERTTVLHGLRPGALLGVAPEQMLEVQHWSLLMQVPMVIVGLEGVSAAGNASAPYRRDHPSQYRVYLGADPHVFFRAWQAGDNLMIGTMLGFPPCCISFFDQYWREQGWRDLTYPAMRYPEVSNRAYSNLLLRSLGVRPVFHLPCSQDCLATWELGDRIAELMTQSHPQEAAWARELLSMPMEWTSMHGVAIVVTPIFKIVYNSDPLPTKVTWRLLSDAYPQYGARGRVFPFSSVQLTRELIAPLRLVRPEHRNGFASIAAMEHAHRFILEALPSLTGGVLDLGCGNGRLLREIQRKYPETTVHGVEANPELAQADPCIVAADLFGWQWGGDYQCVLLAMQRLLEVNRGAASALLARIRQHTSMLLLYSYDGPHPEIDRLLTPFSIISSHFDGTHAAFLLE